LRRAATTSSGSGRTARRCCARWKPSSPTRPRRSGSARPPTPTTAGSRPATGSATTSIGSSPTGAAGEPRLPGLASIACVEAARTEPGHVATSTRDFLSSAPLTPERLAAALRGHGAIANSLHRVLDVTFDADRTRNRRDSGPENPAILRRLTRNLPNKARPNISISRKRKRSGRADAFARTIIGHMR
jgi:predicted transposase YbfD/YdcC